MGDSSSGSWSLLFEDANEREQLLDDELSLLLLPDLDAALDLDHALGVGGVGDAVSAGSSSHSEQLLPPPKASSSTRQKQEIEYLRAQVAELEARLEELQRDAAPSSGASSEPPTPAALAWQRIASHQQNEKQRAEIENVKLREMLTEQLKIARGLERLLRKRRRRSASTSAYSDDDACKRRRALESACADDVFEQLEKNLEMRYRAVDEAFRANGLANLTSDIEEINVREAAGHVVVEVLHSKVFPFDFDAVRAAVWKCSTSEYIRLSNGFFSSLIAESDDCLRAGFSVVLPVRRTAVNVQAYVAIRRFVEEAREVYAWEMVSILSSQAEAFDGIQIFDYGWNVVKRLDDVGGSPCTIVHTCSCRSPEFFDLDSLQDKTSPTFVETPAPAPGDRRPSFAQVGVLSDVILTSQSETIKALFAMVESLLMDELLQSSNGKVATR
ncbi:hypothetical protein ATCC90586_004791 [Pythium insidiosum]|nr:hypothetical protein ATCC90586_004791 [Pythium insidiosum]